MSSSLDYWNFVVALGIGMYLVRIDLVGIDLVGIDSVGIDSVGIDLVGIDLVDVVVTTPTQLELLATLVHNKSYVDVSWC